MTDDADAGPWERTLEDMDALADELESEGWDVIAVQAGHTTPVPPEAGDSDRFGLVYTVPGDAADPFESAFEPGAFTEYEVYRRRVGDRLFLVTRFADPERERAILLAGSVDLTEADALIEAAREAGELYTHVQLLDWTHLGSFRHDDPSLFFPE